METRSNPGTKDIGDIQDRVVQNSLEVHEVLEVWVVGEVRKV
jgi:hypothetical protein